MPFQAKLFREGFLGEVVFEQSYEGMHDVGRWRVSECALRAANNTTVLPNVQRV